jgi:hypothetical protein
VASLLHEAIVELFRNQPRLAFDLLRHVVPIPEGAREDYEGRVESGDLGDAKPLERAADFVASFGPSEKPVRIVVEVQLRRDPEKHLSWPGYVAVSWARSAQRTYLLVLAIDAATARWAAEPIDVGHFVFHPIVVGPDAIPLIIDAEAARRSPELSVLAVGLHRDHAEITRAAVAALAAIAELDEARANFYSALVMEWLPLAARAILEAKMDIKEEFALQVARRLYPEALAEAEAKVVAKAQADAEAKVAAAIEAKVAAAIEAKVAAAIEAKVAAKAEAKARLDATAEAVLSVLVARGLSVSEPIAARVRECRDLGRLNAWLELAVRVEKADALFD